MGFSTCSMVVDDVHFHLFLFSLWLLVIVLMILNEWEWMEVVCWRMKLNLTIFSFFSFLQWWKQTRNEISFVLFFVFADFADCYQFSQNETNRHSFWIVIWESVILIKSVEMIEISTAFAKNVLNLFRFFFLIWVLLKRRNVERGLKSACSQQLVKFEKARKKRIVWFFAFVKRDETPSRLDWLNAWNWLQSIKQWKFNKTKQTTISTTAELDFLLLLSVSEGNAVFSSFTNISTFFECLLREQKHLKRENGNENGKVLVACKSAV